MKLVHYFDKPPPSDTERYLSWEEMKPEALYELDSDRLERIGLCIDGRYFYGLNIEENPQTYALRLRKEIHQDLDDPERVRSGSRPLSEVAPALHIDLAQDRHRNVAILLTHQLYEYYKDAYEGVTMPPLDREIIETKYRIYSEILTAWENETLPHPDEHGDLDLAPLKRTPPKLA